MTDPHCSKCCPIKPPKPPTPWVPHLGVYLWLASLAAITVAGWWTVVWAGSRIFG